MMADDFTVLPFFFWKLVMIPEQSIKDSPRKQPFSYSHLFLNDWIY